MPLIMALIARAFDQGTLVLIESQHGIHLEAKFGLMRIQIMQVSHAEANDIMANRLQVVS